MVVMNYGKINKINSRFLLSQGRLIVLQNIALPDGSKRLQGLRTILVNIKPVKTGGFRTTNGCGTLPGLGGRSAQFSCPVR